MINLQFSSSREETLTLIITNLATLLFKTLQMCFKKNELKQTE
jgi:hypothetical protein